MTIKNVIMRKQDMNIATAIMIMIPAIAVIIAAIVQTDITLGDRLIRYSLAIVLFSLFYDSTIRNILRGTALLLITISIISWLI